MDWTRIGGEGHACVFSQNLINTFSSFEYELPIVASLPHSDREEILSPGLNLMTSSDYQISDMCANCKLGEGKY